MDLSIIILSYNTKDITDECLSKLQFSIINCEKKLKNEIEVIVLDNGSQDGSVEMIKKKHSWVKLIPSVKNLGFSKGNNLAFEKTTNEIVLFLNSDVFVEENTLEKALNYFQSNLNCDVLGPKLVFGNGAFQPSAGNLPDPVNIISWILGLSLIGGLKQYTHPFHPNYKSFFENEKEVGWVSGAFLMLKREVFVKAGGFDGNIFMYLDEVELCKRIKKLGFKVWFNPQIKVVHLHGASSKSDPAFALVKELKGLKYYFTKHYKNSYLMVKLFLIIGLVLRIIAFSLLGKTKRARAYIEGLAVV